MLKEHESIVTAVAATPDGAWILSADWTRRVRIRSTKQLGEPESLGTIGDDGLTGLAVAPDGVTLALGGSEKVHGQPQKAYPITLWDFRRRKMIAAFESNPSPASLLAFSAQGKVLVSAAADSIVRVWNVAAKTQIREHRGNTFAVSPSGNVVAVGHDKGVTLIRLQAP